MGGLEEVYRFNYVEKRLTLVCIDCSAVYFERVMEWKTKDCCTRPIFRWSAMPGTTELESGFAGSVAP